MTARSGAVDTAVRVVVPAEWAEAAGALLMEVLGPFEQEDRVSTARLTFYPPLAVMSASDWTNDILALLPAELRDHPLVSVETSDVSRGWAEGWKDHFHPIVIGRVRIRPPWEPPLGPAAQSAGGARGAGDACGSGDAGGPAKTGGSGEARGLVEVVINPGMGFGTGLHPTTRGALELLQRTEAEGALVDAGTGSGILSVAAAKLGWGPIFAFDNDPVAVSAAGENLESNGVVVELSLEDVGSVSLSRFAGATVLANMTLEPVRILLGRFETARQAASAEAALDGTEVAAPKRPAADEAAILPVRMVVSGILAGDQEREVVGVAARAGLLPGSRIYETEWVSMELLPSARQGARTVPEA
ncbi:MAG TPA: 50S ribosomal protein L11 methyltransferase [Thermoleophilia bacterium]